MPMTKTRSLAALALALGGLSLASCAPPEDLIKGERGLYDPQETAFAEALTKEYIMLTAHERGELDYDDADWFENRMSDTAYDDPPQPTYMDERDIPDHAVQELTDARARLIDAFDRGTKDSRPIVTAHAQAMFDCWMQEQEEDEQPEDIRICREGFYRAMAVLEPKPEPVIQAPVPEEPAAKEPELLAGPFYVYFAFDSDVVAPSEDVALEETLKAHQEYPDAVIYVRGHTDTMGTNTYNIDLSQRRSRNVAAALVERGIPAELIELEAYGEERTKVPTGDQRRLRTNRRVEIWLND